MKLGIMQPYFLPYIGYFQLIKAVDKYVIYDDVNYIKGGWINRNNILLDGKSFLFNLILSGASPNKLINEIFVSGNQSKLLKTIKQAYQKAPYFSSVFPLMEKIIDFKEKNLALYNGNSIMQIADYLQFDTEFIYSSEIKEKNDSLRGQDKILNICGVMRATKYINAIGGRELYDKSEFQKMKVDLFFLKPNPSQYRQFNNEFIPYLSMLDVLMFNSVAETNELLDKFELI